MGGSSSSPRRVTISEDDVSGTVQISESVARRLLGQPEVPEEAKIQDGPANQLNKSPEEVNEDLKKLETYYRKRINALEVKNKELYNTTTDEFAQAVQEVEAKFLKTTASPVCDDLQQQVLKCYQDNPNRTLNCSQQVKQFKACVQDVREKVLTAPVRQG